MWLGVWKSGLPFISLGQSSDISMFLFSPWAQSWVHFPGPLTGRCGYSVEFWTMKCRQKWCGPLPGLAHKSLPLPNRTPAHLSACQFTMLQDCAGGQSQDTRFLKACLEQSFFLTNSQWIVIGARIKPFLPHTTEISGSICYTCSHWQ